jgi:predicted RND superfamily exporter protein
MILYRYFEGPPTPLVLVLIPLVWSLATLDAMHLYHRFCLRVHEQPGAPAGRVLAELYGPCLVTSVTTAAGLLMLAMLGRSPLLEMFGVWGTVGTVLAFACTFALGPSFLSVMPPRTPPPARTNRILMLTVGKARRHWPWVVSGWLALTAVSAATLPHIRVQGSYPRIHGGPADGPVVTLQRLLGSDLMPLQLYLEATEPGRDQAGQLLGATIRLTNYLRGLDETTYVLSAGTLVEELVAAEPAAVRRLVRGPAFLSDLGRLTRGLDEDPRVRPWVDFSGGGARIEVHLRPMEQARKLELIEWIRHFDATMLSGYRVVLGGPGYLYPRAEQLGWHGALRGGVATSLVLILIAIVTLRRAALVVVALAGNLVPLVVLGGIMVAAGVPWSLGLLAIPVVLLSLAVDDTIHLLWPLRSWETDGTEVALDRAVIAAGPAILATTLILAVCLGGLGLSGLQVNRQLGFLFAVGIVVALACDLTLVPALIRGRSRARPGKPPMPP